MKVINRLKTLWFLLFATLSTVFMIEVGTFSPWIAAICGAVAAFGLSTVIRGTPVESSGSAYQKHESLKKKAMNTNRNRKMNVEMKVGWSLQILGFVMLIISSVYKPPIFWVVFGFLCIVTGSVKCILSILEQRRLKGETNATD